MILVIGGRSKIGVALIEELLERGEDVRVLIRSGEPRDGLPVAIQPLTGDLADSGLAGCGYGGSEQGVPTIKPAPGGCRMASQCHRRGPPDGVELLVRSSIVGADKDSEAEFIRSHSKCDRYLEDSGVPYVILRPNLFMQNVPELTIPSIDSSGCFALNCGTARISMVDTRDVAAAAAVVLTEPGHVGSHYDLTGPEALSYADVAAKLTDSLGRQINYVEVSDEAEHDALVSAGLNAWFVNALTGLNRDYRRSGTDGYAAQVTDTVASITGRPARTLDDLLAEVAPGPKVQVGSM